MAGKIENDKESLRERYRRRRDEVPSKACVRSSQDLTDRLIHWPYLDSIEHLAGYVSFKNEINIGAYLVHRIEAGLPVYLPRVRGENLEFVRVPSLETLETGAFGIMEPTGEPSPTDEIEVFIIPGLVFDRFGGRIGFGKGFYDRVLCPDSGPSPLAVGVCYAWQLIDSQIPLESHDRPMDVIATDEELISASHRVKI